VRPGWSSTPAGPHPPLRRLFAPPDLVAAVRDLLTARGLHPDLPPVTGRKGMALGAAGKLLRARGIVPAVDYTCIDRPNAPDPDER
jgi:hypothetical protein